MGILWLMGAQQSTVLFLLLVAALGLTWWEARQQDFDVGSPSGGSRWWA